MYNFIITYILLPLAVIYSVFNYGGRIHVDAFLVLRAVGSIHIVVTDFNPLDIYLEVEMESRRLGTYPLLFIEIFIRNKYPQINYFLNVPSLRLSDLHMFDHLQRIEIRCYKMGRCYASPGIFNSMIIHIVGAYGNR